MGSDSKVSGEAGGLTSAQMRERIHELRAQLAEKERKEVPGAMPMTPRADMLDVRAYEDMHPDQHVRFVNVTDPAKVQRRKRMGYVPVTEAEAKEAGIQENVRHGNEDMLMKIPEGKWREEVERIKKLSKERLKAHRAEVEREAESVIRALHDQYGIDIPLNRLLIVDE